MSDNQPAPLERKVTMKKASQIAVIAVICAMLAGCGGGSDDSAQSDAGVSLTGQWRLTITYLYDTVDPTPSTKESDVQMTHSGTTFSFSIQTDDGPRSCEGTLVGATVTWHIVGVPTGVAFNAEGAILANGKSMSGTFAGYNNLENGEEWSGTWSAVRI